MKVRSCITRTLFVLLIAAVTAPALLAQSLVSGDLTGTVTDPSGAVVSGATVTLKSSATGSSRTTTTNANGAYRFSLLPPGTYNVSVTATGFSKSDTTVNVAVGQASISDLKLSVGASSQTVEVSSAAPLVQADNADLSTNYNQTMIANQPNGGNDITYVAQTAPGVTMNTGQGYGNFSSYGLPSTSNLFTINGENDMDPYLNLNNSGATNLTLGKNDIQEATVVNNAYSGQYGQQAGAQVSYVTKSGTNQFHGNAEYWWTGRAMDANDWFNNLNGTSRPFANNNEWAASLGGPIKKDKTFFFVDTEGLRYIVPSTTPVFAPSPAFAAATLANLSAIAPNEVPLYQQVFWTVPDRPRLQRNSVWPGRRRQLRREHRRQLHRPIPGHACTARNGVDPQRTSRPELLRQGPRLLAGAHGPRHPGDERRSHQQCLQRGQLSARLRRTVAVEPRFRPQRDQPVHRGRQLLPRHLHPERSRAVPLLRVRQRLQPDPGGRNGFQLPPGPQYHAVSDCGRLLPHQGSAQPEVRRELSPVRHHRLPIQRTERSAGVHLQPARSVQRYRRAVPSALPLARDAAGCAVGHGPVRTG